MKLYLYLGRRDRKGMMLLSTFPASSPVPPTRVTDLSKLQLPHHLTKEIQDTIHENRMEYEPWIESAKNFQDLKASLKKRGYKNLPLQQAPKHMLDAMGLQPCIKDIDKRKTMLRRGSSRR